jgi:hypothetical protein
LQELPIVTKPDPRRVAEAHFIKVGGEVIFKKDRGGDASSWAYADHNPSKREIPGDFNYSPNNQKPLAEVLRGTLAALGHCLSAYNTFAKLKSARLSPDGSLGGRGYIMKIADMRKQYMNTVEALSALSDTLYDEINAPHWSLLTRQEDDAAKAQVSALIQDSEEIKKDPEAWAEDELADEFGETDDSEEAPEDETEDPAEDEWGDDFDREASPEPAWTLFSEGEPGEAGVGKVAKVNVRDLRLRLRVPRVAAQWAAKQRASAIKKETG